MMTLWNAGRRALACLALFSGLCTDGLADDGGWKTLGGEDGFAAWKAPTAQWTVVKNARVDPNNFGRLKAVPGAGVMINGPDGKGDNLFSKESYGDVEVHLEFVVPKGSNSGIKLEGVYEIQIQDSWGVKKPKGSDCGGICPAQVLPKYHHIDDGYPPRVNASLAPGDWQTLEIVFKAPRFDSAGKKTASARFVKVTLNGQVVQDDVEVPTPTGHFWQNKETPTGPIFLQADHGPVAFRNVRVRPRTDL